MPELIFETVSDALMNQKKPNQNYGGNATMTHQVSYDVTGKVAWYRTIGNFHVSPLAGSKVNAAKLVREIYSITNGGQNARLSRCTRPAEWTEGGVTWNTYDGVNDWSNVGGDHDETGPPAAISYTEPTVVGVHEIAGLKDLVEDALANRGGVVSLITFLADEDPGMTTQYLWRSKEYGSAVWRLVVDHQPSFIPGGRDVRATGLLSTRAAPPSPPAQPSRGARAARPRRSLRARRR